MKYAPLSFPNGQNLQFIRQFHPVDTTGFLSNYWRYSDTVDMPAVYNGVDLNNKDSVFFGGTENIEFYNPWYGTQPSWFAIFQTDSLLNIRWERFYGGDAYYVMTNLIAIKRWRLYCCRHKVRLPKCPGKHARYCYS